MRDYSDEAKTFANWAEKVILSYLEFFTGVMLAGGAFDVNATKAAAIAAIPTVLTAFINAINATELTLPFWPDLVWRAVRTYTAGLLGYLIALPVFDINMTLAAAAATAALPGALAVVKALIAERLGSETAALLPSSLDVTPPPSAADDVADTYLDGV